MAQNVKNLSAKQDTQVGSLDWIPGLGRFPAEGEGNPFQYSCLENSRDSRAWQAIVLGGAKSQTRLSLHACHVMSYVNYVEEWVI